MTKSQETADLATFTEEILNGKLHYLCNELLKEYFLQKQPLDMFNIKKVFLKISQNSQGTHGACNLIIKETPILLFPCAFREIFKKTSFNRTPPGDYFFMFP